MDLSKIFVKDANPTKMGGQAVMEGIMMKGDKKTAVAVRLPSGDIHIKTEENPKKRTWAKIPIVRGVIVFVNSLIQGTKTLMYSADVLEKYEEKLGEGALAEKGKFETWLEKHFGERAVWNILIAISVIISLVFSIGIFVIGPTAVINWMTAFTENEIVLNLTEGLLRIAIFVIYVLLISKMKDIHRVFQYHGADSVFISGLAEPCPENSIKAFTYSVYSRNFI